MYIQLFKFPDENTCEKLFKNGVKGLGKMTVWNIDGMFLFPLINYVTQMLDKDPSLLNNVQILQLHNRW